jgi:hypothetical protein
MDDYTQKAIGNNKKILGVLCYDTPWIHADNKRHFYIPPEKHDLFVRFVSKTVSRYKAKVTAFEIWNEPNNKMKTFWGGPDEEFFELVKKTVTAIREIDGQIKVVTPGLFRGDSGYLEKMFRAGALHQVDVVSFHPYGMTLKGYLNQIRKINDILQRSGFKGEVWITEMGFPTGGLYPWRSSENKLPSRIVKTLVSGFSMNIQTIIWYELFDRRKPRKLNSEDFFGLVKRNIGYEYKKGAFAFGAIARNIPGTHLVNDKVVCNNPATDYYYFQNSEGDGLLIIWNKRRQKTEISIPGKNCVRWSISSPEKEELHNGPFSVKAGREPLVFTFRNDSGKDDLIKIKH